MNKFRIIVIDDNPKIHMDFIKILAINEAETKVQALKKQLFVAIDKDAHIDDITIEMPIFEIETATQGMEGFEKIAAGLEEGRPYSLAIVDIRMPPGLDGIQTIKKIWAIDKRIQIIICTAYSDYSWMQTIKELGMSDNLLLLHKPFTNDVVRQMACSMTRKWELSRLDHEYICLLEENATHNSVSIADHNQEDMDGVLIVTKSGNVYDVNSEFSEMWDISIDQIKSLSSSKVFDIILQNITLPNKLAFDLQRVIDNPQKIIKSQVVLNDKRRIEYYTQPHKDTDLISARLWCFRDITKQTIEYKQWEYHITHDSLTGLANRITMMESIKRTLCNAEREESKFALLYLDVDNFRQINENYSHLVGDELLSQFAKRISSETRAADMFFRYEGDKFVFIVHKVSDAKQLLEIVNRLQKSFGHSFSVSGIDLTVTVSVGIAIFPDDESTPEKLLNYAELNMCSSRANRLTKIIE